MANRSQRRHPSSGMAGTPIDLKMRSRSRNGVVIAYPHPVGEVNARFHTSLIDMLAFDWLGGSTKDGQQLGGKRHIIGHMPLSSGANITSARNKIVKAFLDNEWGERPEWLFFIDADMTFQADTIERLLESANAKERPIMGGLCFALMKGEAQEVVPTIYGLSTQGQNLIRYAGYPPDQVVQVAGTGAACLLVHRSVLETMRDRKWDHEDEEKWIKESGQPSGHRLGQLVFPPPRPWFAESITGRNWGDELSEDLTFCLRAQQCGFPVFVDTRVKTGHVKPVVIDEGEYRRSLPAAEGPAPTYVVIPVKGQHHFTRDILDQLRVQGGYEHIFLFDNAHETDPLPEDLLGDDLTLFDATGYRFHRMWNDGIRQSIAKTTRCNIAILNNDLILGDEFLVKMAEGLRSHPQFLAVCGNYDNRQFVEIVQGVKGVAAGREDGTGGFAGFGFMLRGEVCSMGLLFDETYNLWYGDNDLLFQIEQGGGVYGIVRDAHMTHIGGGSNTSGDGNGHRLTPEWKALVEEDEAFFIKKWQLEGAS